MIQASGFNWLIEAYTETEYVVKDYSSPPVYEPVIIAPFSVPPLYDESTCALIGPIEIVSNRTDYAGNAVFQWPPTTHSDHILASESLIAPLQPG